MTEVRTVVDDEHHFEPEFILDRAKGNGFIEVVVVGRFPDGFLWVSSSDGGSKTFDLLDSAKALI